MIKKILFSLFATFCFIDIMAQELTVKSFVPTTDAIARTRNVKGTDGNVCAAVVVRIPSKEATFDGGFVLGRTPYKNGEYILDMQTGAAQMRVSVPGYNTIDVKFRDYIGSTLQSKTTYLLTINMPQAMNRGVDNDNVCSVCFMLKSKCKYNGLHPEQMSSSELLDFCNIQNVQKKDLIPYYEIGADKGYSWAVDSLVAIYCPNGYCYSDANLKKISGILQRAADSGLISAQLILWYLNRNTDEAIASIYINMAAKERNPYALYVVGLSTENKTDKFNYLKQAAELGCHDAMYELSQCYYYGLGTEKNVQMSTDWLQKANKSMTALLRLGFLYYEGKELKKDFVKAMSCWDKGARLGDEWAQHIMFYIYNNGIEIQKDKNKALEYDNCKSRKYNNHDMYVKDIQKYMKTKSNLMGLIDIQYAAKGNYNWNTMLETVTEYNIHQ